MTDQDQHVLVFTNQLVRALGRELRFVSLPHGQSQGWVTCAVELHGASFQFTRFDDGRITVQAREPAAQIVSLKVSAEQYAGHLEAVLNGRANLS